MSDSPIDKISKTISEEFDALREENAELKESLGEALASLKFEDRGWLLLFGLTGDNLEGLELKEVQDLSKKMRIKTALGGLYKRGADLHTGYVHGRGINIPGTAKASGRGNPGNLRGFFKDNYETLFSTGAKGELQRCRYTDGNILALCERGKPVRLIPFKEIVDLKVNPDFPSEIWAYKRSWLPNTLRPDLVRERWYYTKRFRGVKTGTIQGTPVAPGLVVDKGFNKQVGWVLGIPDVAAAAPWIEAYNEIMQYGRVVNESLSKLLYKIISPTKKAAQNASAKVAGAKGHGNTASFAGEGADIQAISTAGKGYDFTSARPVGAEAAAALNVSLAEFLSDTSAAGSSYGALAALAPSVQNAMLIMQGEFIDFYAEIFDAYDITPPEMSFDPIVEPDFYRQAQGLTLLGVNLSDQELRAESLDLLNIDGDASKIPPTLAARSAAAKQAASPDQGRNSPAGSTDSGAKNDQRTDNISEALAAMKLDEMRELVERFESTAARLEAAR